MYIQIGLRSGGIVVQTLERDLLVGGGYLQSTAEVPVNKVLEPKILTWG